jgi:hypothetical protein
VIDVAARVHACLRAMRLTPRSNTLGSNRAMTSSRHNGFTSTLGSGAGLFAAGRRSMNVTMSAPMPIACVTPHHAGTRSNTCAIGVYSLTPYAVAHRTREIGIRVSLGARPAQVVHEVLAQGLRWCLAGTVSA